MKETDGARAEVLAEAAALRALALEFEADARKMRATPRAIANPTNARWADERDQAARACRFMADVLAQEVALVERMAQALHDEDGGCDCGLRYAGFRDFERAPYQDRARAALAAMLQKENADGAD